MIKFGNWGHIAESLRHRDHRLFNITLVPALISLWAQRTGIGWLTWELTHSPTWLGIIAAADLLPVVIISPFAGAIADRASSLFMMRLTQAIIMIHALVLWGLTAADFINIWGLLVLSLVTGINQPFSTSGRMVFFPSLVPKAGLGTAIAINSTIFNGGRAIGPALAGIMIAPFGVASVFLLNFACFAAHMVNLFRIKSGANEPASGQRKGMMGEIAEGIRYTIAHPGIGPMVLLLVVASVASRPIVDMIPGFADAVFSRGAEGLGWLLTAMGIGGFAAAIWLAQRGPVGGLTKIVLMNNLLVGIAMAAFALIGEFWAAAGFLAVVGFAQVVTGTGTQTLMQTAVDGAVRGRVMSVYTQVYRGMPALGAIAMGWIAEQYGLDITVAGAGVICVFVWMVFHHRRHAMADALERSTPT
ncbi:MAG: MFS transporter [Alphaproteobacteria bacterium]